MESMKWVDTLVFQRRMLAVPPLMSLQVNPAIGIIVQTLTQVTTIQDEIWQDSEAGPTLYAKQERSESVSF